MTIGQKIVLGHGTPFLSLFPFDSFCFSHLKFRDVSFGIPFYMDDSNSGGGIEIRFCFCFVFLPCFFFCTILI